MEPGRNGYRVAVEDGPAGWTVRILDPGGAVVHERACRDGAEARLFASTVRQHIYWLSPERFREYYRLPPPGGPEGGVRWASTRCSRGG